MSLTQPIGETNSNQRIKSQPYTLLRERVPHKTDYRDEIVCLFTDLDSLYCTVILIIWINRTGNTCCLPVCATPHTGVEPCVGPKTIVVGFPRIVIIGLLALAKTGRRFTGLE